MYRNSPIRKEKYEYEAKNGSPKSTRSPRSPKTRASEKARASVSPRKPVVAPDGRVLSEAEVEKMRMYHERFPYTGHPTLNGNFGAGHGNGYGHGYGNFGQIGHPGVNGHYGGNPYHQMGQDSYYWQYRPHPSVTPNHPLYN